MNCNEIKPNLSAFLDGEAIGLSHVEIDDHLSGCAVCSGTLAEFREIRRRIRQMPRPVVPRPLSIPCETRYGAIRHASGPAAVCITSAHYSPAGLGGFLWRRRIRVDGPRNVVYLAALAFDPRAGHIVSDERPGRHRPDIDACQPGTGRTGRRSVGDRFCPQPREHCSAVAERESARKPDRVDRDPSSTASFVMTR